MSIHSQTKNRYVVIVNRKELRHRAKHYGYKDVTLIRADDLDDGDTEKTRKKLAEIKKPIVFILYRPEGDIFFDSFLNDEATTRLRLLVIDLFGEKINETETVESLEQAVRYFPPPEKIEIQLFKRGYVSIKGNPFHCGNCYAVMRPGDKYCQRCGTPSGEGAFQSSYNFDSVVYLYGPPIKMKYKCDSCGYVWITDVRAHRIKHCPECGCADIKKIQDQTRFEFGFQTYIGFEEPFEEKNRPVLFTENEILELIKARTKQKEGRHPLSKTDDEIVFDTMRCAGLSIPDIQWNKFSQSFNYPRTEKEDEQILLARRIVWSAGSNPDWNNESVCPHCSGSYKAVLGHRVINENRKVLLDQYSVDAPRDAIVFDGDFMKIVDEDSVSAPAYLCLCCGTEYGELTFTKEQKEQYEKQDQKDG